MHPNGINPISGIREEPDVILDLLERVVQMHLSKEQREIAKRSILEIPKDNNSEIMVLDL